MLNYHEKSFDDLLELLKKYGAFETPQRVKKNEILLDANNVAKNIYFIKEGILKVSYYDENARTDVTMDFLSDNDLLIPFKSFFQMCLHY